MTGKNPEEAIPSESLQTVFLSSPKSMLNSAEPTLSEATNEDAGANHQQTTSVNCETLIQHDVPISLPLTHKESNLLESANEPKIPISDSGTSSSEVDSSAAHQKDLPDGLPSVPNKVNGSNISPYDLTTPPSSSEECNSAAPHSLVKSTEEIQGTPLHNFQNGASDELRDVEEKDGHLVTSKTEKMIEGPLAVQKVANEMAPAIQMKAKEGRPRAVARPPQRQMSLGDIRQKASASISRFNSGKYLRTYESLVDTTSHIESVRVAATRFGGSVDWKARRTQTMQGSGHVVLELDRLKKEILECKRQAAAAEASKVSVLNELESTERLIEELKHDLERAQAEEAHAKEDSEFAELMVKELEEGVASDDSVAAKEQLKVVKERYVAAVAELKSVKNEFRKLQEDYDSIIIERDISIRKAEAALAVSKETEKQVEELTVELNKGKGMLDLAHTARHDAEDHRIGTSLARDEDRLTWEKDLKCAEEELKQLDKKLLSVKDMKSKLETSSSLLLELNAELAAYMEAKLNQEAQGEEGNGADEGKETHKSVQEAVVSSRSELEELKQHIYKAKGEVGALKVEASSLKVELDKEKAALATMQQMEGMASIAVSSLEAEISRTQQELEAVRAKEKESREKMIELPKMLQQAAREADEAKSVARTAQEELRKAKEEAEQAKAGVSTTEFRLRAVLKEIEAAKESERLALDAIRALEESELAVIIEEQDSPRMITLQLDKYAALSEKAHDAEQRAHERTAAAIAQIEAAKDSELKSLSRLSDAYKEVEERKRALLIATERADKATEGKLAMEQELRKWRAENGQRRKAGDAAKSEAKPPSNATNSVERNAETRSANKEDSYALVHPLSDMSASSPEDSALDMNAKKAKKQSFFPRLMMFLARRRLKALK